MSLNTSTTTASPQTPDRSAQTLNRRAELGSKLLALRQKLGSTQVEMARTLGVLPGYLSHVERGYHGLSIERVEAFVQRAYREFSAPSPVSTPAPMTQLMLPAIGAGPAEVEPEAVGTRNTRQEVARRITAFQREFALKPKDLAQLFGVSSGHTYVLRRGDEGASVAMRRKVLSIIEEETQRRRGAPAAPIVTAVPTVTAGPIAVARDGKELADALVFDFKTTHRFTKLPDGTILVVKGV